MQLTRAGKMFLALVVLAVVGYVGWTKYGDELRPQLNQLLGKSGATSGSASSGSTSGSTGAASGQVIRVTGDPWSGYSTFRGEPRLTRDLQKRGITLKYLADEKYFDQNVRMEALAKGDIDIAVTTLDAFLQHGAKHMVGSKFPGVVIFNIDVSAGGDAIFLGRDAKGNLMQSFDEVQPGMKVCYAAGTPSEHLFDFASLSFTALSRDLDTDNGVVANDCWKKLEARAVNVAVLWQPVTAIAERAGYKKIFATGGQAKDVIVDIAVANRDYLKNHRDTLLQFMEAYFGVINEYVKPSGVEAHAKFITDDCGPDCNGDVTLGRAVLSGIDFLDYSENMCLWWGQCGKEAKMPARVLKTARLLVAKNKLKQAEVPDPATILDSSLLVDLRRQLEAKAKLATEVAAEGSSAPKVIEEVKEATYRYTAAAEHAKGPDVGTLKLPNIYFNEGSYTLDPNGRTTVDSIGEQLKAFPALCVKVYGFTNSRGNPAANKTLSDKRAHSIVEYLTTVDPQSFPPERFVAKGFGKEQLLFTKDARGNQVEDLEASRRTEFKLFDCNAVTQ